MGTKARLLMLVALAAVALLVWQLAAHRAPAPDRAEPARGTHETATAPAVPEVPKEETPATTGQPDGTAVEEVNPNEGIRVRVLADGKPLDDAYVYAMADDEQNILAKEPGDTWFAGVTGDLTVGAAHARYGPVRKQVHAEKGLVTDVTLELPPGETLDVLVVADRAGTPVAGASVFVLRAGGKEIEGANAGLEDVFDGEEDPAKVDLTILGTLDVADFMMIGGAPAVSIPKLTTDGNGRARVTGLPPGTVDLVVTHPDFVPTRLRRKPVGKEAEARLSGGGSLTVLAPFVDGRAAEGYLCGAVRPGLMISMPVGSATVDAEGKAFFPHLPPGPLRILVAKANHPLALMTLAMGGTVVEKDASERKPPPPPPSSVPVEEEGKGPGEGEQTPAPEDEPPEEQMKQLAAGNVTIVAGEHRTLDLRETKGARLEGVVVGTEADTMVLLLSGEGYRQQVGMQQTREGGKFAFEDVEPGRYRVTAAGDSGGIARADCEVKEGDTVVTVRLEAPKGAIAGRILGPDGKPAKKARVLVAPGGGGMGQAANLAELMEQLSGFAESDEEGRFRVQGMAAGAYRVLGSVGRRLDVADVVVREGEEASVELRVDDARVRRLVVRLEGADRNPVEGSVVVLGADGGAAEMLALTEDEQMAGPAKGSATHEFFLAPGRYRLVASAPGLAPVLGEAVEIAGDRDLTLTLGPGVHVELAVEGPAGPLGNREVDVRNDHGIRLSGHSPLEMLLAAQGLRTDGAGILSLDAVPPGRYVVYVDGKEKGRFDVASLPVAKRIRAE